MKNNCLMLSIKSKLYKLYIRLKERNLSGLKHLFYNNHSKDLIIVFAGFAAGDMRKYN